MKRNPNRQRTYTTKHDRMAIYRWIVQYKRVHDGLSPTYREIGIQFGIQSSSLVSYILSDLEHAGLIKINPGVGRGIRVVGGQWSMVTQSE